MKLTGSDYYRMAVEVPLPPGPHACPVCNAFEFSEAGSFEICETCGWEDDPVQEANQQLAGGANKLSLEAARKEFALRFGKAE